MTPPVSGGVPEQGPQVYPDLTDEQIEEIAHVLDEPQLRRLHGGILALSLHYVAAVQEAPRAIRQLRAALERPRPALPSGLLLDVEAIAEDQLDDLGRGYGIMPANFSESDCRMALRNMLRGIAAMQSIAKAGAAPPAPEPPPLEVLPHDDPTLVDVVAGLAVACGEARVREEYRLAAGGERRYTPLPEETKLFDMLDRAHLGAALPAEHAPPEPSEKAKLAGIEAAEKAANTPGWGLDGIPKAMIDAMCVAAIRAAYATDRPNWGGLPGLSSLRAPQSGPDTTEKITRVELIDHRHGAPRAQQGRVFVALEASVALSYQDGGRTLKIFVADRVGSGAETPPQPETP